MTYILNILNQLNWIDILAFIIFIRILYIAYKNGIAPEIFKFLGLLTAVYLSLHYYSPFAKYVFDKLSYKDAQLGFIKFVVFTILGLSGYLLFFLLRALLGKFVSVEFVPKLSSWGGVIVGVIRGFLSISLILFFLLVPSVEYFSKCVKTSYLGSRLVYLAPSTYSWFWDNIMSKFMTSEKFNKEVLDITK